MPHAVRIARPRLLPLALGLALAAGPAAGDPVPPASPRDLDQARVGTPVAFRGEVLFLLPPPAGTYDVAARAERIEQRIGAAVQAGRRGGEVRVVDRVGASDVMVGPDWAFSVTDDDAAREGTGRSALAGERAQALARVLDRAAEEGTPRSLAMAGLRSGAAVAILAVLLWVVLGLSRRLRLRAARSARQAVRDLRRTRRAFLSPARLATVASTLLRWLALAFAALAAFACVEFVLGQLPWTRSFARGSLRVVVDALRRVGGGIADYLPNLVYLAVILAVARLVLGAMRVVAREVERGNLSVRGFHADWARPTLQLLRFLVLAVAAVAAFPYLPGAGSPAFQAISLFVGVLVSLGSSGSVANLVAGVILTYVRPFAAGDRIRVGEVEGMVFDRSLLVTRLRTDKNEEVMLPNATVLGTHVRNYSARARSGGLTVHTSVTIGYGTPWRQVHALLLGAAADAAATGLVNAEPAPFVLQTALDDFYVRYELNAATGAPERLPQVYARLHEAIQDRFAAAGVEIMSPHYAALRDGQAPALPGPASGS
jgi:small-conductance mechanosensitive channel